MTEPEKMNLESMDIAKEKRAQLQALFPEVFAEGKIDFEQLKRVLGDWVEPSKERFGLNWPGKADCMKIIQQPSIATLKPARAESVNFDETENLFIEGDNLEVLKLLQKAYFGKVKMIYIDPPYNTGKEFIYPDKYSETLDTYLRYTGQIDENGHKFTTNTDAVGHYHSNWLNMMYPRLYLAKSLLRDDGVIFISIDDHEQSNLKGLCDIIFGEENFLANIIWEKRFTRSNNSKTFATLTEHLLCYRKSAYLEEIKEPRDDKANSTYSNPDNDPRGVWTSVSYVNPATKEQRPNLSYDLENPITGEAVTHPTHAWKCEKSTYLRHVDENRLYWGRDGNNTYPRKKKFLSEMEGGMVPVNFWTRQDAGTTDEASKDLEKLMKSKVFDFPKPFLLIQKALRIGTESNGIILDFFTGSATTAHAVMRQNAEDSGNRKYIMVQLPEACKNNTEAHKAGYKTIADIGKERIRRTAKKIKEEHPDYNGDLGFKVFKLAPSNFKIWQGDIEKIEDLERQLFDHVDHINNASTPEDILYELLLKSGFPLTTHIAKIGMAGKQVFCIEDGKMLICLDKALTQEVMDAMAEANPLQVICLDEGFQGNDQLKANAVQTFKSRAREEESEIVFRTV